MISSWEEFSNLPEEERVAIAARFLANVVLQCSPVKSLVNAAAGKVSWVSGWEDVRGNRKAVYKHNYKYKPSIRKKAL